jgi:hypothetical protein
LSNGFGRIGDGLQQKQTANQQDRNDDPQTLVHDRECPPTEPTTGIESRPQERRVYR